MRDNTLAVDSKSDKTNLISGFDSNTANKGPTEKSGDLNSLTTVTRMDTCSLNVGDEPSGDMSKETNNNVLSESDISDYTLADVNRANMDVQKTSEEQETDDTDVNENVNNDERPVAIVITGSEGVAVEANDNIAAVAIEEEFYDHSDSEEGDTVSETEILPSAAKIPETPLETQGVIMEDFMKIIEFNQMLSPPSMLPPSVSMASMESIDGSEREADFSANPKRLADIENEPIEENIDYDSDGYGEAGHGHFTQMLSLPAVLPHNARHDQHGIH